MQFKDSFIVFPKLETKRLILREYNTVKDPAAHLELFKDPEVYEYFDWYPKNIVESENIIKMAFKAFAEKKEIRWSIALKENESETIGNCMLNSFIKDSSAEIGYIIGKKYWKKGYMTEVLTEIINYGFKQMGLHRIQAVILAGNLASIKLLNKLKFQEEGYLRKYSYIPIKDSFEDSRIFSILKEEN